MALYIIILKTTLRSRLTEKEIYKRMLDTSDLIIGEGIHCKNLRLLCDIIGISVKRLFAEARQCCKGLKKTYIDRFLTYGSFDVEHEFDKENRPNRDTIAKLRLKSRRLSLADLSKFLEAYGFRISTLEVKGLAKGVKFEEPG